MALEDASEEEKKNLQATVEGLEGTVKMLELKGKNAQDHSQYCWLLRITMMYLNQA